MLKVIKITFYLFFLLVLFETYNYFHKEPLNIGSSVQEIGSGFMDTAQQILNEGGSNLNRSFSEISNGTDKILNDLAE